jgi:hypothetical protein
MPPRASDVHQQAVYGRPDRQSPLHEGLALARDEAMREFIEFAMGEPLPTNRAVTSADFNIPADENLVKKLAVMGLATLAYRARRGDTRSAMYLVDRCLGTPDKPFVEKVANMNLSEAQTALKTELLDSGISEKLADQMVESFSQQRTRSGKQNRVNVATHEG